jgi:1,5-anhydro-D-fructose reductase (1,5-anhydro-D-mannitol-forming)
MSVGWGILGLGGFARRMAPLFSAAEGAHLAAISSRDPARAASLAAEFGAARSHAGEEALFADPDVRAIYIATPNALHAEQAIRALRAGKHVLVEKPMALTVADAEAMVEAADRAGVQLGVGFHLRHHPVHRAIKQRLAGGAAGDIIYGQAQFCSFSQIPLDRWQMNPAIAGAGSIMGLGVHMIDLLRYLTGQEVTSVTAMTDGPAPGRPVEFLMLGTLAFDGGAYGQVISSRRLPNSLNNVTIYTTHERLVGEETNSMQPSGRLVAGHGPEVTINNIPLRDAYLNEIEAFSRAVAGGPAFEASGRDGLRVVEITVALLESARAGRAITLQR